MITFKQKGDFSKVKSYLVKVNEVNKRINLNKYGEAGVKALQEATPVDTGLTANSWYYEITNQNGIAVISFHNSHVEKDYCNIAIILQYGHGTKNGGWVEGRDYINPAIQSVFEKLAEVAWEEVSKS